MNKSFLAILLLLASCSNFQSKQQKAESLTKKYLDSTLNGSDKYELITFGKIDTLRSDPRNDSAYKIITAKIDSTNKVGKELYKSMEEAKEAKKPTASIHAAYDANFEKRYLLMDEALQYYTTHKGKPQGWLITQMYKLKKDTSTYIATFKIDSSLTRILSQQTTKK